MGSRGNQAVCARPPLRIVRRSGARRDIAAIWQYISADNQSAGDHLIDRIDEVLNLLADNPRLGSPRPELGANLRSFVVGNYVLFYQPFKGGVRLLRVLHGARDMAAELRRK